jgi:hypothetical protein
MSRISLSFYSRLASHSTRLPRSSFVLYSKRSTIPTPTLGISEPTPTPARSPHLRRLASDRMRRVSSCERIKPSITAHPAKPCVAGTCAIYHRRVFAFPFWSCWSVLLFTCTVAPVSVCPALRPPLRSHIDLDRILASSQASLAPVTTQSSYLGPLAADRMRRFRRFSSASRRFSANQ